MSTFNQSETSEKSLQILSQSEKFVTTKELADVLGVNKDTVNETVNRLKLSGVLRQDEIRKNNYGGYLFNEEQATIVKMEIQKHHNLASRQIDAVTTDYEMELMTQKVIAYHAQKAEEFRLRAEQAEKTIELQAPKVEVFDRICNAENLKPVETVATNLGYGKNSFFALMRGMGIFFYSAKDSNGRKCNLPKQEYKDRGYFVTKEEPYTSGEKDYLYTKIYVTGKGEAWLAKILSENLEK